MRNRKYSSGLLVEDVRAMRTYLRTALQDECREIAEAASLGEAREHLRSMGDSGPDFIVLDLDLPDGNGLDLLPEVPFTTRVIALTADVDREIELQCQNAGCDLVIEKSQELSSLRDFIAGPTRTSAPADSRGLASCGSYVTFLAEVLVELEDARNPADLLAIRRIAHRLRGTAIHFGYPGIGSAAKSVSSALSTGRLERVDAATSALRARISDALEAHQLKTRRRPITEVPSCTY
ncbi:MAG: response regulator [Gammaproteobacteria bacterium]|jgi:CheY-like chemotaxis protein